MWKKIHNYKRNIEEWQGTMKEEEEHLEIFVVYYKWSYFFFNCEQNLYYILLFFLFCVRKSM